METYEFHPAADIFPMMNVPTFHALKADIEEHGQQDYVVLFDGKIIDGRNRYRACKELGIECDFSELEECADPVAYVLSANLHRRHLTTSQRAKVAAKAKELYQAAAKDRMRAGGGDKKSGKAKLPDPIQDKGQSRDKAAALLGVSPRSVDMASKVLEKGTPELVAAVDRGDVAISRAAKIAELPTAEQAKAIQKKPRAAKAKPREKQPKPMLYQESDIRCCSNQAEGDLCAAVRKQLERMRDISSKWNGFKFDVPLYKKTIQELYDLVSAGTPAAKQLRKPLTQIQAAISDVRNAMRAIVNQVCSLTNIENFLAMHECENALDHIICSVETCKEHLKKQASATVQQLEKDGKATFVEIGTNGTTPQKGRS